MKIKIAGQTCSMGCAYAEGSVYSCQCACAGKSHGSFVPRPVAVKCSPAAEKRCKEGNESGDCKCACNGINHGIYQHIQNFEEIKISHYCAR